MKIGLYFGSFNPIHNGHLLIAQYVLNFYTDKVWFVISPQNPLKKEAELLDFQNRLKLLKLAISDNCKFEISEIELEMPLPSYTINTLEKLKNAFGEHNFFLIIGSDNFLNIYKWKSYQKILDDFEILIYERPKFLIENTIKAKNITVLKAPLIDISSTMIRDLIKLKKNIQYLVPTSVLEKIRENDFYIKDN